MTSMRCICLSHYSRFSRRRRTPLQLSRRLHAHPSPRLRARQRPRGCPACCSRVCRRRSNHRLCWLRPGTARRCRFGERARRRACRVASRQIRAWCMMRCWGAVRNRRGGNGRRYRGGEGVLRLRLVPLSSRCLLIVASQSGPPRSVATRSTCAYSPHHSRSRSRHPM